jgi:phosphatidylinositol alpha-1,6-mannosyltransferase
VASGNDPVGRVNDTNITLFVSRKYPPSRGGMETAAVSLYSALEQQRGSRVELIKYGWPNRLLPLSVPLLFVRSLWHARGGRAANILLQDGVLAPMGVILGKLTRTPVVVIIHGLEVTHTGGALVRLMRWALPKMALLIAVSDNTAAEIRTRYPGLAVEVVRNGVGDAIESGHTHAENRAEVGRFLKLPDAELESTTLLLTVGRLVPRKGVAWFVREVLPILQADTVHRYLYFVVGTGAEHQAIADAAASAGVAESVQLLGGVEDAELRSLYGGTDVFVMPNVPVPNDVEGFGLVALEASSVGTPVVATAIDGIPDAVHDPGNGVLVPARDPEAFAAAIIALATTPPDRESVRRYTHENFSWSGSARILGDLLDRITRGAHGS